MNKSCPIIDGHIDLAWNNIALGRVFEESVLLKRLTDSIDIVHSEGEATVGYPEIQKANIRILFATIWVETQDSVFPTIGPKFSNFNEAKFLANQQYNYYNELIYRNNYVHISNAMDITRVLHSKEFLFSIIPIIEGLDFVENLEDLQYWLDKNIRIIAPVWQKNRFGGCSEFGGGLTEDGLWLLQSLQDKKVAIDIAHMSDESVNNVFDIFNGIVINSHTTCRHFVNEPRLISDEHILKIHRHNGVIGLMTWNNKLKKCAEVRIDDYIDHMCYIADITGDTQSIAIGSSMDGGYGVSSLPQEMNNIQSLELLYDAMIKRSFSKYEIESILYKNWERILRALY